MQKQIQIRIFPDGTISSETFNIKGKECLKYMKVIEEMLAARIIDSAFTPEYYETETQTQETMQTRSEINHE